ncbi:hypothetical protein [Azonexus sp. R2A61]|uniref:hypothetical protein n=1 Tax=Azonexus sp. R2A61 TaxID=2744443 RepID=UPI001F2B6CB8|nr:hypothetical protein [Azonexus sp. R2A61]
MATWKKVLLWTIGIVVVTMGGCLFALDRLTSGMCATTVFDQIPSPSNKLKAVIFQVDCGASTDFNTHVAIVKTSFDTANTQDLPKSFFAADSNHGRAPAGLTRGPDVRVKWASDSELDLQYHQFARAIRTEESQAGVMIKYQTLQ